jgi:SpoVK/Ycf46/Vps4 family AAA+-type ATPase
VSARVEAKEPNFDAYGDHFEHLADEFIRLDLLIKRRVVGFREENRPWPRTAIEQQVYIGHEEVDWLLRESAGSPADRSELQGIEARLAQWNRHIDDRVSASLQRGSALPLMALATIFRLEPWEVQILVVCLAPEMERKYDRLYAYLQDDITRKRPSLDLVGVLFWPKAAERWRRITYLSAHSRLFRDGLISRADDPHNPSGSSELGRFLSLDERIRNYLLGDESPDPRLGAWLGIDPQALTFDQVLVCPEAKTAASRIVQRHETDRQGHSPVIVHLQGPGGVGKQSLAQAVCAHYGRVLLRVDLDLLMLCEQELEAKLRLAFREALLLGAGLYLDRFDSLLSEETRARFLLRTVPRILAESGNLVFLGSEKSWRPTAWSPGMDFYVIAVPMPDAGLRELAWSRALAERKLPVAEQWVAQLARQFRLTLAQIQNAVAEVTATTDTDAGEPSITREDLYSACRNQSNQRLRELALKIEPRLSWEDLVLPDDKTLQLKEMCSQARQAYRVFSEWGFGRKHCRGKGLSALFSGPPGTGKTMAAEVIAADLGLDLYRVDLSAVVSKYIGETEKNLSHIFREAETSNAVLFFDEADALFGKRTGVADAHDRYANIETSFLLQKMEDYEGVVILASNLRDNMDDAFTRRLRFIVDFPFPNEAGRRSIWQIHFPSGVPLGPEVDFDLLARRFQIAGGNIKNVSLNAAFLAAERDGEIGMDEILRATRREFEKVGKLWNETGSRDAGSGKR